ncbi:hypothetical protein [uncultured Pontibacter sp.]|uniref:hypothetical protein n=1 Tax=uncultured Pontibacter sp. TaxID=453356 RepID=UPI0026356AD9|nr:hypothetical protein [uncultured Pontibacter sp.]
MNNKLIILLLTMLLVGCGSKTTIEEATGEPEESDSQFTAFELRSRKYWPVFLDVQNSWLPLNDSVTNDVKIVRIEPYVDQESKPYNDLMYVFPHNQFEAIIYQDTLYLKFFQRSSSIEGGVRVKVVNDEFSTSHYLKSLGGDGVIITRPGEAIQPYSEVEEYVDTTFVANRQVLRLNRKSYEVGDSISGDIIYEGRRNYESKNPMQASILAKGSFKGTVKEGKQFTLTTPKF